VACSTRDQGKPICAVIRLLLLMTSSTHNLAFETLGPTSVSDFPQKKARKLGEQPASRFVFRHVKHFSRSDFSILPNLSNSTDLARA
jgi:hypothetical protein